MLLLIIVVQHFPPRIAIMTSGHPGTVPWIVKVPGGTNSALTPTSMVCTSMVRTALKECNGTSGKVTVNLSRGPRWRSVQRTSKITCNAFNWLCKKSVKKQSCGLSLSNMLFQRYLGSFICKYLFKLRHSKLLCHNHRFQRSQKQLGRLKQLETI